MRPTQYLNKRFTIVTALFVPGNDMRALNRAAKTKATLIVPDMEDMVP